MPFEVEPVYIKLGYYKPPADATLAPGAAPAASAPANAQPAPADNTGATTAPATPQANPPQN
jgi:hypothetical protein